MTPTLTSEWRVKQDPGNRRWRRRTKGPAGTGSSFRIRGSWTVVDQVKTVDEFTRGNTMDPGRPPLANSNSRDDGRTVDTPWIRSGDMLADPDRCRALRTAARTVGGSDCLFVEAGGPGERDPVGWQTPWCVMKRRTEHGRAGEGK